MIDTFHSGFEAPKYLHQQPGFEYTERDGIIGKGVTQELDEFTNPLEDLENSTEALGREFPTYWDTRMLRSDY